jgi:hypothetical protein
LVSNSDKVEQRKREEREREREREIDRWGTYTRSCEGGLRIEDVPLLPIFGDDLRKVDISWETADEDGKIGKTIV